MSIEPPGSELLEQNVAVDRIVVNDKDACAGNVNGTNIGAGCGIAVNRQGYGHGEARALAQCAFCVDLAIHEFDQPRGDGKANPGAWHGGGWTTHRPG